MTGAIEVVSNAIRGAASAHRHLDRQGHSSAATRARSMSTVKAVDRRFAPTGTAYRRFCSVYPRSPAMLRNVDSQESDGNVKTRFEHLVRPRPVVHVERDPKALVAPVRMTRTVAAGARGRGPSTVRRARVQAEGLRRRHG
jgi:hypothetical protein